MVSTSVKSSMDFMRVQFNKYMNKPQSLRSVEGINTKGQEGAFDQYF
jgi:hypothetical protein